jgi:YegS/Rv2252/BmrU family lipid kinase
LRRVALIYNPASGQHSGKRAAQIAEVLGVLHRAGVEATMIATESSQSTGAQVLEAVRQGCDTVIACGGDGTAHESLQSLVGGETALGVVPMGTANALAADLGLPASPVKAIRMLLAAKPLRVSVGRVYFIGGEGVENSRYFIVAAGVGADALFLSRLDARLKRRLGYALYIVEAFRVWATHSFPLFEVSFMDRGSSKPRVEEVSQLLAVGIRNFGGVVNHLVPGATLRNHNLRLVAFKTRSRYRYLRFMLAVLFARHTFSGEVEVFDAATVECRLRPGSKARLFVEADGELLGTLPARIEIVPEALTLLIPS